MSQLWLREVILEQSAEVLGVISLFGDFFGTMFPFLPRRSITGKSTPTPRLITLTVATDRHSPSKRVQRCSEGCLISKIIPGILLGMLLGATPSGLKPFLSFSSRLLSGYPPPPPRFGFNKEIIGELLF